MITQNSTNIVKRAPIALVVGRACAIYDHWSLSISVINESFLRAVRCYKCSGPPESCDIAIYEDDCVAPDSYCINHVTNLASGDRLIQRGYISRLFSTPFPWGVASRLFSFSSPSYSWCIKLKFWISLVQIFES